MRYYSPINYLFIYVYYFVDSIVCSYFFYYSYGEFTSRLLNVDLNANVAFLVLLMALLREDKSGSWLSNYGTGGLFKIRLMYDMDRFI